MNNKLFLISLLISSSVQIFGQDVVPRQALIDTMSSFEDSMKKDKDDNPEFTKIPIIIDSTEGWEWIGKEEAGRIINEVQDGVKHWKSIATRLGIAKREMDVFEQVYQRSLN